jgi:hypothetical protein
VQAGISAGARAGDKPVEEISACVLLSGIDPAPAQGKKSDDGAIVILRARPRPGIETPGENVSDWLPEFVWAYRLRGKTRARMVRVHS